MTDRLFGTDGIRAKAGEGPLRPEALGRLGAAIGRLLRETPALFGAPPTGAPVLFGRDTRESGPAIEAALASGFAAAGVDVVSGGVLPTPAVAELTRRVPFALGVVVSASHNPWTDNGVKAVGPDGRKLSDAAERAVEAAMAMSFGPAPFGARPPERDLLDRYLDSLADADSGAPRLGGMSVVLDCAHGAAVRAAPAAFRRAGATVTAIHCAPDGRNINVDCGALHPGTLADAVREARADLGFAFDGDADRCIAVDAEGTIHDGDVVLAVAARWMLARGELPRPTVVGTIMSNLGLKKSLAEAGIGFVETPVGDRFVAEALAAGGWGLGGEQSGHVIFARRATTGDGIRTALVVARIVRDTGKPLAELARCMTRYPQVLLNVPVRSKPALDELSGVKAALSAAEAELAGSGRINLRYSGTEPLARVMVEAATRSDAHRIARAVADAVQRALGEATG